MIRTRQNHRDGSDENTDTPSKTRWAAFRSVIEPCLRFVENLQRHSQVALIKHLLEERVALRERQSNSMLSHRPEIEGSPPLPAEERGEKGAACKSVLIVDDERNIRLTICEAVEGLGVDTDTAATGEEALTKLREKEFDLMLLDLHMPGVDGMEVLRRVREIRPDIRVIMMTAYGTERLAAEARRLGAVGFIRKPFVPERIREMVARAGKTRDEQRGPPGERTSGNAVHMDCPGLTDR